MPPNVVFVGEKSPKPVAPIVHGARYVYVMRDGRDVVVSLLAHRVRIGGFVDWCDADRMFGTDAADLAAVTRNWQFFEENPEQLLSNENCVRKVRVARQRRRRPRRRRPRRLIAAAIVRSWPVPGGVACKTISSRWPSPIGRCSTRTRRSLPACSAQVSLFSCSFAHFFTIAFLAPLPRFFRRRASHQTSAASDARHARAARTSCFSAGVSARMMTMLLLLSLLLMLLCHRLLAAKLRYEQLVGDAERERRAVYTWLGLGARDRRRRPVVLFFFFF